MIPWDHLGFVDAILRVIAYAAIVKWLWWFIQTERNTVRPGRTRTAEPDRSVYRLGDLLDADGFQRRHRR